MRGKEEKLNHKMKELQEQLEHTKLMVEAEGRIRIYLEAHLEKEKEKMKEMEKTKDEKIAALERQLGQLSFQFEEEKQRRKKIEEAKENLENEIEELTRSLFEEANGMVSNERREKFRLKKRLEIEQKVLNRLQRRFSRIQKDGNLIQLAVETSRSRSTLDDLEEESTTRITPTNSFSSFSSSILVSGRRRRKSFYRPNHTFIELGDGRPIKVKTLSILPKSSVSQSPNLCKMKFTSAEEAS